MPTLKMKMTSKMKTTIKSRGSQIWRWPQNEDILKNGDYFKIEDELKRENVILKTVPGPSLYDPSCHCFYPICRIFMKVYENFILSIGQCSTNNKFCSQYIFEYICKRLRISNIFVTGQLTKYEYRIYSFLANRRNTNIE